MAPAPMTDARFSPLYSYVGYLPFFQSQRRAGGHLLGGWELSGAFYLNTGLPLTVTGPYDDPAGLGLPNYPNPRVDQSGNANQRLSQTPT
jgi:hypothetical protein